MADLKSFLARNRRLLLVLIFVTPLGFYTKFYTGPLQNWVNNSLGGVFYEIFWCLVLALFFQRLRPQQIAGFVLLVTCALEFLQLWHPPFLESLRANFIGATILGSSFTWSDFPYYLIGSIMGYFLLNCSQREPQAKR
ncbi:MAG TPA: DUF2809 domain-containing protein [Candidatus Marinimicrobia bacterium]|nr:DUF2809 domain-containing protein [Candidatus Neomarinimicrobiota bacterium]